MHKETILGMSHKRFLLSRTQKESTFWEFFWDVNFENTLNAKLFDVFYISFIESILIWL